MIFPMARLAVGLALVLQLAPRTLLAQCCGDCGGDGSVTINDLITGVRNALEGCGDEPCCGDCDGDGDVSINELITTVRRAIDGCDPDPTASPSETPTVTQTLPPSTTPTVTPTETPTSTPSQTATPVRALDNGIGTITDLTTGLTWEKKVGGDGVPDGSNRHDVDNRYPWRGRCQNTNDLCLINSECELDVPCLAGDQQGTRLTIYTWLAQLNNSFFANQNDWRIPTLDELRSLRDLDETPSIDPGFHAPGCSTSCLDLSDPDCNCTGAGPTWTSTEDPTDPTARAWRIDFDDGAVVSSNKGDDLRVRAVRGP